MGYLASSLATSAFSADCREGGKDAALQSLSRRQHFRMPLQAKDKLMIGAFDSFDHAVLSNRIDDYTATEFFDRLVVPCVHLQSLSLDNFVELRAVLHENSVNITCLACASLMLARAGKLRRDVLIQRAAQSDVYRLRAAADAENRQVALERRCDDLQFEFGSPGFNNSKLLDWFLAVKTRMDIKISAAD